jgi:hypothetical protein
VAIRNRALRESVGVPGIGSEMAARGRHVNALLRSGVRPAGTGTRLSAHGLGTPLAAIALSEAGDNLRSVFVSARPRSSVHHAVTVAGS